MAVVVVVVFVVVVVVVGDGSVPNNSQSTSAIRRWTSVRGARRSLFIEKIRAGQVNA
jgi:hypothetical protein